MYKISLGGLFVPDRKVIIATIGVVSKGLRRLFE